MTVEVSDKEDRQHSSGFVAFFTSLPGILAGVAAVIAAVGTLASIFIGNEDPGSSENPSGAVEPDHGVGSDGGSCFAGYFDGIPQSRIASVEVGARGFSVIASDQPKEDVVALRLMNNQRSIGAMRFRLFTANTIFKIESIVDERCKRISDYSNVTRGGDKNVLHNWDAVRLRLGGNLYDLRVGAAADISVSFASFVS